MGTKWVGGNDLGVGDAGFGSYVKTYKPWFIGRDAFIEQEENRKSVVVRFQFNEKGVRMAHSGDPVVDKRGKTIGYVTSCAVDANGFLTGQAYIPEKQAETGNQIFIFQSASNKSGKAPAELSVGDKIDIPSIATILSRFP